MLDKITRIMRLPEDEGEYLKLVEALHARSKHDGKWVTSVDLINSIDGTYAEAVLVDNGWPMNRLYPES